MFPKQVATTVESFIQQALRRAQTPLQKKVLKTCAAYTNKLQKLFKETEITPGEFLLFAIEDDQPELFGVLLNYPLLDLNFQLRDCGASALHIAVEYDRYTMCQQLLYRGINPDLRDREDGRTPLMHALLKEKPRFVQLLLSSGADPRLGTMEGITPLDVANCYKNLATKTILQQYLNSTSAKNHDTIRAWFSM